MTPRTPALLLVAALAACGEGQVAAPFTESPSAAATSASPSPSASPSRPVPPSASASRTDLKDGKHPGYLKSLDTAKLTLVVDVVQFLTGEAAEKAAKEDGEEAFDYYVRNQNTLLRTLPVAPDVKVVTNTLTSEETGNSAKDTEITLAKLKSFFANGRAQQALFNLTISGGVVTVIHEQYLP